MQMLQILFYSSKFNVYTKFHEVYFTFEQVTVWNIEDRSNPKEKHIAALIGILLFFHNLQTSISFFVCTQARNYLISTKGDS